MLIRTMEEAENYLYNSLPVFHRQGPAAYKADIGNISALMEYVGNPHTDKDKFIHIAGTNGKGSTAHLTSAYLQTHGYKVGVYTSPHYTDIRERIKINGVLISKEDFVACLNQFIDIIDKVQPSFFEIICAMAFLHFKKENVDFAIIETGMGGRLDSTNIIRPIISVITNISFDHQQFLGNTLDKIAFEKAGIIKENIPCVIGEKSEATESVFTNKAASVNAPIYFSEDLWQCNYLGFDGSASNYQVHSKTGVKGYDLLRTGLHGNYQGKNLELFLSIAVILDNVSEVKYNRDHIEDAVLNVTELSYFIGRWQTIQENPKFILESAHNIAGISQVVEQIMSMKYDQLYLIYGTVADKDITDILKILPLNCKYLWTRADIPRAMDEKILKEKAIEYNLSGESYPTVSEAIAEASKQAKPGDLIIILGSIFVVGDALKAYQTIASNALS